MKLSQLDKGTSIAFNVLAMVAMVKGLFGGEKEKKKRNERLLWIGKKLEHN